MSMTNEERTKLTQNILIYLDNNYPKGKRGSKAERERNQAERAAMVGAYSYAVSTKGDQAEPWLAINLMVGRLLSEHVPSEVAA